MSRLKIASGNWKMNTTLESATELTKGIINQALPEDVILIFGVPATHLHAINDLIKDKENIFCAAQNAHHEISGAFTGEISVEMIAALGVKYVILGHSERRSYFGETDELLAQKVKLALDHRLEVIFCCGESLEVREEDKHIDLVKKQVSTALFGLSEEELKKVIIAYEPVWAIGTGRTATPEQAQEMHLVIREMIAEEYGNKISDEIAILYGGSVKPANAKEIFSQEDVDGGLVGGASLNADGFVEISRSFS